LAGDLILFFMTEEKKTHSRRTFLRNSLGAAAFTIVPRHVLGRGFLAPSDRLTKGVIGLGDMGKLHLTMGGTQVVGICDVDSNRLQQAKSLLNNNVRTFDHFRELIQLPELDIVHIATPPHWHGIIAEEAARAGKDIWCEKPMTRTIGEGKRVQEAVQQYGRIFRLSNWYKNEDDYFGEQSIVSSLKKLISNNMLGWPLTITLGPQFGFDWQFEFAGKTNLPAMPVPPELNYDRWLGPAPYKPYNPHRVHSTFRGYWDYSGGGLAEAGQHYLHPIQYLLDKEDTSPVSVEADAPQQHPDAVGKWKRITFTYADGCRIILDGEGKDVNAPFIAGPQGKLYSNFVKDPGFNVLDVMSRNLEPTFRSDIPQLDKKLSVYPEPASFETDFAKAVRERKRFAVNEQNGHRSCTLVNMAKIALQVGRPLEFDPVKQIFLYDDGANRLIDPPVRTSWK
jgi:myo-inositol 2-dehydrogenase / D-chiro-inositol 1-dehydrogenase